MEVTKACFGSSAEIEGDYAKTELEIEITNPFLFQAYKVNYLALPILNILVLQVGYIPLQIRLFDLFSSEFTVYVYRPGLTIALICESICSNGFISIQ
jgi:hypothetical protein